MTTHTKNKSATLILLKTQHLLTAIVTVTTIITTTGTAMSMTIRMIINILIRRKRREDMVEVGVVTTEDWAEGTLGTTTTT